MKDKQLTGSSLAQKLVHQQLKATASSSAQPLQLLSFIPDYFCSLCSLMLQEKGERKALESVKKRKTAAATQMLGDGGCPWPKGWRMQCGVTPEGCTGNRRNPSRFASKAPSHLHQPHALGAGQTQRDATLLRTSKPPWDCCTAPGQDMEAHGPWQPHAPAKLMPAADWRL